MPFLAGKKAQWSAISWIDGWTEGANKEGWEGPHRSSSSGSPLCRIEFSKSFYWFQTAYIQPSNSLRQLPITLHTLTGHPLHTFEASFKHLKEVFKYLSDTSQKPHRYNPPPGHFPDKFQTPSRHLPNTFHFIKGISIFFAFRYDFNGEGYDSYVSTSFFREAWLS